MNPAEKEAARQERKAAREAAAKAEEDRKRAEREAKEKPGEQKCACGAWHSYLSGESKYDIKGYLISYTCRLCLFKEWREKTDDMLRKALEHAKIVEETLHAIWKYDIKMNSDRMHNDHLRSARRGAEAVAAVLEGEVPKNKRPTNQ